MECIETDGISKQDQALRNSENTFRDYIDKINCPGFFISIEDMRFKGTSHPSFSKIQKYLENKINELNPDDYEIEFKNDFDSLPSLEYEDSKVFLKISLIPKPLEARSKVKRAIGISSKNTKIGGNDGLLIDAVKRKATRYGNIEKPYVIAINSTNEWGTDEHDIRFALFDIVEPKKLPFISQGSYKIPDKSKGVFFAVGRPCNTRVSAVFITNVNPTNLHFAKYWIYYHPFAKAELSLDDLELHSYKVLDTGILEKQGKSIKGILEIPDFWPGVKSTSQ